MRRKIDLVILLLVLVFGVLAVKNAQAIGDWWHAQRYDPPSEVAKLADDAGMSEEGRRLFYRFSPQIVDQQTLDAHCDVEKLGCAEGTYLYILEYDSQEEYSRAVVTAAHEMLHVAYSRLNASEREQAGTLLRTELAQLGSEDIAEKLKDYPAADYENEAHSFIGSELADISPQLQTHYTRYFTDRSQSARAYLASPERFR